MGNFKKELNVEKAIIDQCFLLFIEATNISNYLIIKYVNELS